jgi:hypothetical protein
MTPAETDPERLALARAWFADPYGRKSPALQALLVRLRRVDPDGKTLLVCTDPGRTWTLALLAGDPPRPRLLPDARFSSPLAAERAVFRRRWTQLYGTSIDALGGPDGGDG